MTTARKNQISKLILALKEEGRLNSTAYFTDARKTKWGAPCSSLELVEEYNESLGRLFGRGDLTGEEVEAAMKP